MAGLDTTDQHQHSVSFEFDKYNKPKLLSLKDSIASDIINAVIMKPGNLPSRPTEGIDFFEMIAYQEEDPALGEIIQSRIESTCGVLPGGAYIMATDISMQETIDGDIVALLLIKLSIPQEENDSILGVALSKSNDAVKFNFDYVSI